VKAWMMAMIARLGITAYWCGLGALAGMILLYGIASPMLPPAYRTPAMYGMAFLLAAASYAIRRCFPPPLTNPDQEAVKSVVSRFPAAVPIKSLTGCSMITMGVVCVAIWTAAEALTGFQLFVLLPTRVHILFCLPFLLCWLMAVVGGNRTLWLEASGFVMKSFFSETRVRWKDVASFEVRQTPVGKGTTVPYVYCRMRGSNDPSSDMVIDKSFLSRTADGVKLSAYDLDRILETWRERAVVESGSKAISS